jgi:hypothetical protein
MVISTLSRQQGYVGKFAHATHLRNTIASPYFLDSSGNCKDQYWTRTCEKFPE